jgi:hypothetical protein
VGAFEAVTLVVCALALAIAVLAYLRAGRVTHGRHGQTWFDHREDIPEADRPNEDVRDAPIPKRPLRGRPE